MNVLMLTSCNRIKQVLLSLSLNAQIIKNNFAVVIVDSSTPNIEAEQACELHQIEDPYNVVKPNNYCSDVNLLYEAEKYFKQLEEYKVIHYTPRLNKQRGDSTSMGLGIMQAALMGNRCYGASPNMCLKLTGTSILKYDILSELKVHLKDADAITWHRAYIGGDERSTRVFGCRPEVLSGIIAKSGWYNYVDDNTAIFEQRFAKLLQTEIPDRIKYTENDENGILLEGGVAMQQSYGRERILDFIKEKNINTNATPYLQEFMDGDIW
jgi:hypothetical protein